jgi:hypothetical protein
MAHGKEDRQTLAASGGKSIGARRRDAGRRHQFLKRLRRDRDIAECMEAPLERHHRFRPGLQNDLQRFREALAAFGIRHA